MMSGPVLSTDLSNYDKSYPDYNSKPTIIGAIGLENIKFASNMNGCAVNFNLYHKMNEGIHKPEVYDPKLRELLRFLKKNIARWNNFPKEINDSKFICYRGLINTIMKTPYENNNTWKIAVTLFKGNIYLCLRDTEEKKFEMQNITEHQRKSTKAGYKFEQYVFSDSPYNDPTPDEPIDEFQEFNCVFQSRLNKHKIVFGAEIDGVACDVGNVQPPPENASMDAAVRYLSQLEFVEAKTCIRYVYGSKLTMCMSKQLNTFLLKLCMNQSVIRFPGFKIIQSISDPGNFLRLRDVRYGGWWCQSFLVGIKRIICGLKNGNGIVSELKILTLDEIKQKSEWQANICMNFLDAFLTYVKECLTYVITRDFGEAALNNIQHLDLVTLTLEWRPRTNVVMTNSWNNEDDVILPEWYTSAFDARPYDCDEAEHKLQDDSTDEGRDAKALLRKRSSDTVDKKYNLIKKPHNASKS